MMHARAITARGGPGWIRTSIFFGCLLGLSGRTEQWVAVESHHVLLIFSQALSLD